MPVTKQTYEYNIIYYSFAMYLFPHVVMLPNLIFVFDPFENSLYYWMLLLYFGFIFLMIQSFFKGRIVYEVDENGVYYNYFDSITTTETKLIPWVNINCAKMETSRSSTGVCMVELTLSDIEVPMPVHGDLGNDRSLNTIRFRHVGSALEEQVNDINKYISKFRIGNLL
jgi:hypothetical protein